jgi:hypothetical protein
MSEYEKPKLKSYGTVSKLTADCNLEPLADNEGGQEGTACSPG